MSATKIIVVDGDYVVSLATDAGWIGINFEDVPAFGEALTVYLDAGGAGEFQSVRAFVDGAVWDVSVEPHGDRGGAYMELREVERFTVADLATLDSFVKMATSITVALGSAGSEGMNAR